MKFGVCMPNQILRPGMAPKSKRHTFNFFNGYLYVNNKASNIACRAELGRFPLNITINKRKSPSTFCIFSLKQSFLVSFDLHCNGKSSFHSHLLGMSEYFNLPSTLIVRYNYSKKICRFLNETTIYIM